MKLSEAWRLSRIPYREVVYQSLAEEKGRMWWGAFGRSRPGREAQDDLELAKRALRIARFDKAFVTVFSVVVSAVPFFASFLGAAVFGLASSISLSLAVTFGLVTLYAIQTLSSFVSAKPSVLLSVLPISGDDFSLVTLFSFIRSVDYMVLGSILCQVLVVGYLTGSIFASLIMLVASVLNAVFAVSVALWFSKVFQKNLLRGGRSKANALMRMSFILVWGLLLVGVGFLFSIPWYILPAVENALMGTGGVNLLFGLLYPFSTGVVVTEVVYSNVTFAMAIFASLALAAYVVLAVFAGKWSLGTVKKITQDSGLKVTRVKATDFSVKTRHPLLAYILKDLKVATKNPGTAFFFAMPVLETLIITLFISNYAALRVSLVLVSSLMGGVFALFLPLALLTAEGKGLEYTKTLPISSGRIIVSKAFVSSGAYAFVPLVLVALAMVKPLTTFSAIFIPFFILVAVFCASAFEMKLFFRTAARSRIASLVNDLEKLIVGLLAILVPELVYVTGFLSSFGYSFSLLLMGGTVLAELSIAAYVLSC
jgi:predicted permease